MTFSDIGGGVCAPQGFRAAGLHCGVRKNREKKDLAMLLSDRECVCAAVYTRNKVFGAPILVTREHLQDRRAFGVVVNSGNANTCNADGVENARRMCRAAARATGRKEADFVVASTGVIGQSLPIEMIEAGMPPLFAALSPSGGHDAALAIMTTDTVPKELAVRTQIGGKTVSVGAMAKGVGMIHPNMATMLCFITTDCAISAEMLDRALREVVDDTFHMVSVDGDTSTNDTLAVLANGLAGNPPIESAGEDYAVFAEALRWICAGLCRMIAGDGEGATKLLECRVTGAPDKAAAARVAKAVIQSSLVKAMMFGRDANWGRVLCAMGNSGADFDASSIDVEFSSESGRVLVCQGSFGVPFDEAFAKEVLAPREIRIGIEMHQGAGEAAAWGCDLTYEYVRINGDYRT